MSSVRPRPSRPRLLLGLVVVTVAALAASAAPASAAFTTGKCLGSSISADGASFQVKAHQVWLDSFVNNYCPPVTAPNVAYGGNGSGAGRDAMTARDRNGFRFGASDEPLTTSQKNTIQNGTAATGDEGTIHQIPVAVGAIAQIVNFPDTCNLSWLPTQMQTAPTATDNTNRLKLSKAQLERMWQGGSDAKTWGQILTFPNAPSGTDTTACANTLITRVARWDSSGSSFTQKDFFSKVDPPTWPPALADPQTMNWPNASNGTSASGGPGQCPTASRADRQPPYNNVDGTGATGKLITPCSQGGGAVASTVRDTDGAIGYADIATARSRNFDVTPSTTVPDNDKFWVPVPRGTEDANSFANAQDPTVADGYKTTGARGANCLSTTFDGVPSSTLGDWSNASGTNNGNGYPVCTLTYLLAWQDYAKPYSACTGCTASEEEPKARTAFDYINNIVNDGQTLLGGADYAAVPTSPQDIRGIARAGAADITYGAASSGGGGSNTGGGGSSTGGGGGNAGGGTGTTPVVAAPSNRFSIPRTVVSRRGTVTFSLRVPGAGLIEISGVANVARRVTAGRVRKSVSRAGTVKVTFKVTGRALRQLKRRGRLATTVRIRFTPRGGTARTTTKRVTLRYRKARR